MQRRERKGKDNGWDHDRNTSEVHSFTPFSGNKDIGNL